MNHGRSRSAASRPSPTAGRRCWSGSCGWLASTLRGRPFARRRGGGGPPPGLGGGGRARGGGGGRAAPGPPPPAAAALALEANARESLEGRAVAAQQRQLLDAA